MTAALDEACRRKGLRINFAKTEVMGITKRRGRVDVEVDLQERRVKQVETFKYLGCTVGERPNVPILMKNITQYCLVNRRGFYLADSQISASIFLI